MARVDLDLRAIAATLPAHSLRWIEANHSEPASYFLGHSGVLLLQWKYCRDPAVADALYALVEGNLHNKALEALWGSPGTLVAALHMLQATGEPRWQALLRRGVDILWQQMSPARHTAQPDREVWLWVQDLYGRSVRYLGAGHGFAGNLYPVIRGASGLDADRVAAFEARAVETLTVAALREPGLVNWEPDFDRATTGLPSKPMLQDCHGAPGIVCRLAGTRSAALQALLRRCRRADLAGRPAGQAAGPVPRHRRQRLGLPQAARDDRRGALAGPGARVRDACAGAVRPAGGWNTAGACPRCGPATWASRVYLSACLRADADLPTLDVF